MLKLLSCVLAACATAFGVELRASSSHANAPVAEYTPYRLFQLILEADLVLSGEIVGLDDEEFVLRVERRIVGDAPEPTLRIKRFQDWMCAARWEPYATGQRVVVFLEQAKDPGGSTPTILSGGGEGEMPVNADLVSPRMCQLMGDSELPAPGSSGLERRTRLTLDQLEQAVRGLRAEVQWDVDQESKWMRKKNLRPRVSLPSLEAFAASSRLARNLCFETRTSRHWSGPRSSPGYRIDGRDLKTIDKEVNGFFLMVTVGDIDGNGVTDLAAGHEGRYSRGSITIEFMNANGTSARGSEICFGEACFVGDLALGEEFGRSLCAPGDIDADGVPDLLVGSKSGVWTLLLARDGTVKRHQKLEDGPQGLEDSTHFGDRLAVLPREKPDAPLKIACGGTRGTGDARTTEVWSLTLGPDGVLRAR